MKTILFHWMTHINRLDYLHREVPAANTNIYLCVEEFLCIESRPPYEGMVTHKT